MAEARNTPELPITGIPSISPRSSPITEEVLRVSRIGEQGLSPLGQALLDRAAIPQAPVAAGPEVQGPPGIASTFGTSVIRGFQGLGPAVVNLAGQGFAVFGHDEIARDLAEFAMLTDEAIQARRPREPFEGFLKTPGNFFRFAAQAVGESVPFMVSIFAGGIGGAAAAGKLANVTGRLFGRGAITGTQVGQVAQKFGFATGAFGVAAGIETGHTAAEIFESTGTIRPELAFAAGAAKGMLEAAVPGALSRMLGVKGAGKTILSRAVAHLDNIPGGRFAAVPAKGVAIGAAESITEVGQEAIDIAVRSYVDENYDALGPQARARILESLASGLIAGFFFGAAGATVSRGEPVSTPATDAEIAEIMTGDKSILNLTQPIDPGKTDVPDEFATNINRDALDLTEEDRVIELTDPIEGEVLDLTDQVIELTDPLTVTPVDPTVKKVDAQGFPVEADPALGLRLTQGDVFVDPETGNVYEATSTTTMRVRSGKDYRQPSPYKPGEFIRAFANGAVDISSEEFRAVQDIKRITRITDARQADTKASQTPSVGGPRGLTPSTFVPGKARAIRAASAREEEALAVATTRARIPITAIPSSVPAFSEAIRSLHQLMDGKFTKDQLMNVAIPQMQQRALMHGQVFHGISVGRENFDDKSADGSRASSGRNFARLLSGYKPEDFDKYEPAGFVKDPQGRTVDFQAIDKQHISELDQMGFRFLHNDRSAESEAFGTEGGFGQLNIKGTAEQIKERDEFADRAHEANFDMERRGTDGVLGNYDAKKHKPGTVRLVSARAIQVGREDLHRVGEGVQLSKKSMQRMLKAKRILNAIMKKYGMQDEKLLLGIDTIATSGARGGRSSNIHDTFGIGGSAYLASKNSSNILISLNAINRASDIEFVRIVAHEFGHIMAGKFFHRLPVAMRLQIIEGFDTRLAQSLTGTKTDFYSQMYHPNGLLGGTRAWHAITGHRAKDLLADYFIKENPAYYFGLSEYLAEQISRYMTTDAVPLSIIDKTFKKFSNQIKQMFQNIFKHYGFVESELHADKAIETWMKSREDSYNPEHGDMTQEIIQDDFADGLIENTKILGAGATPSSPMSQDIPALAKFANVPVKQQKKMKAATDRIWWLTAWGLTMRQMMLKNQHIQQLVNYVELTNAWDIASSIWKSRANTTIKQWEGLSTKSQDNLSKFIFHLEKMNYLKKGESPRQPTDAELIEISKRFKLDHEAMETFKLIRGDLEAFLNKVEEIAVRDLTKTGEDTVRHKNQLAKIKREFASMRSRPFFPHSRFGKFTVTIKEKGDTGKVLYSEFFETLNSARKAVPFILKAFPGEPKIDRLPEEAAPFRGLPPALLAHLKTQPGLTDTQRTWIDQLTVELAPTQSFRKRMVKRENIPGFSTDAMASYASYMWHGSNYLARLEFQEPMEAELTSIKNDLSDPAFARQFPGGEVHKRQQIHDFMRNHLNQILNPGPDWAQARSFAFLFWMGFSVKSAVLNLTQIPMVTYPYLAARYGDAASLGALRKAMGAIPRMMKLKTDGVSNDELTALTVAIEEGVVDESYATELAGIADGPNLSGLLAGNSLMRGMKKFQGMAALMFQTTEKLNRRATFKAGRDLALAEFKKINDARENGKIHKSNGTKHLEELQRLNPLSYDRLIGKGFTHANALAYISGREAVRGSQFQYSDHARARFMQGRKGVIFTFFTFTQSMVYFATHDKGRARFLAMMFLMAGMMGLPGAEDMSGLLRMISRWLGKDFDVEKETRELITGIFGEDVHPDLILHGISRYSFGLANAGQMLGIPIPTFDMSAALSMGRIVPGVSELGKPAKSFEDRFAKIGTAVSGASIGIGINLIKFATDSELSPFDPKRYERAMPRAARDLSKGLRFYITERERTRSGATMIEFDTTDPLALAEIVGQSLGFAPTRLSQIWDRQRMEIEATAYWSIRRSMILRQYDHALQTGDRKVIADMSAAVRRYNNEVAIPGFRISARELRTSMRERMRRRALLEAGIPASKRAIPLVRDIRKLHPEVENELQIENAPR